MLALEDFRDVLDERVRSELGLDRQDDVAIDLAVVDQAEEANAHGNWGATVAMLNPWLTPISMLLRTGEAESLAEDVHGRLSTSLDLLGTAYANMGELDAANEVLRLGIQWAGESGKAGACSSRWGARRLLARNTARRSGCCGERFASAPRNATRCLF